VARDIFCVDKEQAGCTLVFEKHYHFKMKGQKNGC